MPNQEKEILRILCEYANAVNLKFSDLVQQTAAIERVIQSDAQLSQAYNAALKDRPMIGLGTLADWLETFRKVVESLPD